MVQWRKKCLCNIASNRMISLSWGAKKKESSNSTETPSISSRRCVGDRVIVTNQGSKWEHLAKIVKIIESTSSAVVKWDTTLKKDTVDLADCTKYDVDEVSDRKCKATDFYQNSSMNNQMSKIQSRLHLVKCAICFTQEKTHLNYVQRVPSETS